MVGEMGCALRGLHGGWPAYRVDNDPVYTFDYQFDHDIQEGRRRYKMETMDSAEKEALLAMLRPMLAYRPEQRCSVNEVLELEWMTRYAMPDYERMLRIQSVDGEPRK